jgi:hypothetical protein
MRYGKFKIEWENNELEDHLFSNVIIKTSPQAFQNISRVIKRETMALF